MSCSIFLFYPNLLSLMKFTYFIGIDISKESFDVCLCSEEQPDKFVHGKFANSAAGCRQLLTWLKKHKVALDQCFFAMEHTGWYTLELCCFLQDKQLAFALYSPLHLKRSLGLARGKNDRVDAQRIAHYAFLHRHELKPTQLPSASLLKLKNLFAFRERLVKNQASLKQTIKDLKDTAHLVDNKFIIKQSEKQLKLVQQQVEQTEKQIENAIKEDEHLQKSLKLLCSVPGIGLVTAVALILATNNFTGRRALLSTIAENLLPIAESLLLNIPLVPAFGVGQRPATWLTNASKLC